MQGADHFVSVGWFGRSSLRGARPDERTVSREFLGSWDRRATLRGCPVTMDPTQSEAAHLKEVLASASALTAMDTTSFLIATRDLDVLEMSRIPEKKTANKHATTQPGTSKDFKANPNEPQEPRKGF